jgi:hypothetical protein
VTRRYRRSWLYRAYGLPPVHLMRALILFALPFVAYVFWRAPGALVVFGIYALWIVLACYVGIARYRSTPRRTYRFDLDG